MPNEPAGNTVVGNRVTRLYNDLRIAGETGLTVRQVMSRYGWSSTLVHDTAALVAVGWGVAVRYDRDQGRFFLVSQPTTQSVDTAQTVAAIPVTLESLRNGVARDMIEPCRCSFEQAQSWLRDRVLSTTPSNEILCYGAPESLLGRIRMLVEMERSRANETDSIVSRIHAEREHMWATDTITLLASMVARESMMRNGADSAFSTVSRAESWIEDCCNSSNLDRIGYPGISAGLLERVRSFARRERINNNRIGAMAQRAAAELLAEARQNVVAAQSQPTIEDDTLWRGIPAEVASFYRERALDLRT